MDNLSCYNCVPNSNLNGGKLDSNRIQHDSYVFAYPRLLLVEVSKNITLMTKLKYRTKLKFTFNIILQLELALYL